MTLDRLKAEGFTISCITNKAAGMSDQPLSHEEVTETATMVRDTFKRLLDEIIKSLTPSATARELRAHACVPQRVDERGGIAGARQGVDQLVQAIAVVDRSGGVVAERLAERGIPFTGLVSPEDLGVDG